MIAACTPAAGPPSLARDLLASVDCFIAARVETGYAQLLAPGGGLATALTIGLTLYVAVYGYRLVLGRTTLSLSDLVPRFVAIGLMLALVTNWPTYQRVVFNMVFDGPQAIAGLVLPRSGNSSADNVVASVQTLFDAMTDYAGKAWSQRQAAAPAATGATLDPTVTDPPVAAAAPASAPKPEGAGSPPAANPSLNPLALGPGQFVAIALWASALLMLASSIGLLLVVRIILAVLLMFGPVFIALALFAPTRGLFEGWLRATVRFALVPLVVLPLTAVLVAILPRFVAALPPLPVIAFRDSPALAILMITGVGAVVLSQALPLCGIIADAFRLPRVAAAVAVTDGVPAPARPALPAVASRAETIAAMARTTTAGADRSASARSGTLVAAGLVETPALGGRPSDDVAGRLGQTNRTTPRRTGFASGLRIGTQ